jgi:pyruvate kinase
MVYPILTYSRNLGDFPFDLSELHTLGLKAIRLIYKGKTEMEFNARINEILESIREGGIELDILVDLPGKKPIVGNLGKGRDVKIGEMYSVTAFPSENDIPTLDFFNHECFPDLASGDIISIADDELNLKIIEIHENSVLCEALNSYFLTSNRSLGIKNKPFPIAANSEAEQQFIRNLSVIPKNLKVVVSFARTVQDILTIKALNPEIEVIPKIETLVSETDLLEIMEHCETLMLGRGDLSLVCASKQLFEFQDNLIDLCRKQNKELIVGTGLLNGITDKQSPTIAEIMDFGYLRSKGISSFLIAGSNALYYPTETLKFMCEFERN